MRIFLAALAVASLVATGVGAGPMADRGAEADRLLENGEPLAALDALNAAVEAVWLEMPLTVRNVHHVKTAVGYGVYAPRGNNVYRSSEKIFLYAELLGQTLGESELGGKEIGIDVDIVLTNGAGKKVFSGKGIVKMRQPVRYLNKEFMLKIDLTFNGAPPDKYVAALTVRDVHSEKSTVIDVPFEIVE
jgi:hypothetical protein